MPFNFSDEIEGSAIQYEIIYTAIRSQFVCEIVKVPSSLFNGDYVSHVFQVLSSKCHSSDIDVIVFATNALGDGPSHNSLIGLHHNINI